MVLVGQVPQRVGWGGLQALLRASLTVPRVPAVSDPYEAQSCLY